MAYQTLNCKYCGEYITTCHGYERKTHLTAHFRKKHQDELAEINSTAEKLARLKQQYSYTGYVR